MSNKPPLRRRIEDQPIRDRLSDATDKIPEGPLSKLGGGNLIGAGCFAAVEASKPVWQFVPGVKQPGYKVTAHGTKYMGGGRERHKLTLAAIREDVAEFAAEYTATPSNIDYIRADIELVELDEIVERGTYSTYDIVVDVIIEAANYDEY